MPPPPVTPSPHRFVVKKEAAAARRTPLSQTQTHQHANTTGHSGTQQFNATPRFTFSSTPRIEATQCLRGPPSSAARFSGPRPSAVHRAGQDVIHSSSDEFQEDIQNSVEVDDEDIGVRYDSVEKEEEDEYGVEGRTPKRRRVSSPMILDEEGYALDDISNRSRVPPSDSREEDDNLSSSPPPILSSPTATIPKRAPKFILSTPLPPSTPHPSCAPHQPHSPTQIQPFSRPPRFRPPDPPDTTTDGFDPLPEQFSPHRKGQKYIPGGLAAEVRDWLVNLESSIPVVVATGQDLKTSKRSNRGGGDEEWLLRILVDEVQGGSRAGMVIVRGRQIHGLEGSNMNDTKVNADGLMVEGLGKVRIVLAGEGQGAGIRKGEKVEVGKVVGVKGPVWEVGIDGMRWGIGVEWKVIR